MTIWMRGAGAALAALALAGCASMVTGGPLIREGEPTGAIEVINRSGAYMDVVLISACSASTYGLNRLPGGVGIPSGSSYTFEVSAGCWDVDAGATQYGAGYGEARGRITVQAGYVTPYEVR